MTQPLLEQARSDRRLGLPLSAARRVRDRELLAYLALALGAAIFRFVALDGKPMHHDESIHGWISWRLWSGDGYEYDPVYHGPVQFLLANLSFLALGVGDVAMRAAPALLGAAMVLAPWFLRRELGRTAALAAAVVLAVSPSFVYVSRFAREDTAAAAVTLALLVLTFRFLADPRRWHPAALLGLLAVAFATKETAYITAFIGGSFFAVATAVQVVSARRRGQPAASAAVVAALRAPGGASWMWGLAAFALVFTLLFTTFLVNPQGLRDGLWDSLAYWLSQHPVNRGSQPWFFYFVVLVAYELPVLALAAVGAVTALRRRTLLDLFLVWDAALSLLVYSWAGERMPWLIVHPLVPLALLAGIGVATLWESRAVTVRVAAVAAAAAAGVVLLHGTIAVAYDNPADPAEFLVFTQTSVDVPPVRDRIVELDRRVLAATGEHPRIAVDAWGGTSWPWAWYLRDLPVAYVDMSEPFDADEWDVLVVAAPNATRVAPVSDAFEHRRFRLREWWAVDYGRLGLAEAWRWFVHRESWSPEGTMDERLYVRRALLSGAGAGSG